MMDEETKKAIQEAVSEAIAAGRVPSSDRPGSLTVIWPRKAMHISMASVALLVATALGSKVPEWLNQLATQGPTADEVVEVKARAMVQKEHEAEQLLAEAQRKLSEAAASVERAAQKERDLEHLQWELQRKVHDQRSQQVDTEPQGE